MIDELLAEAGLSRQDFNSLRQVTKSDFSGRIVVEVGAGLSAQPIDSRQPKNLVAVYHDLGVSRYIFNPVR